ncbi:hypothetical protein D3C71_2048400 [compost metagenome]
MACQQGIDQGVHGGHVLAAWKRCCGGPAAAHLSEEWLEFGHGRFGELAVSGQFAAEHRQQRSLACTGRQRQGVVAGDCGWVV